MILAIPPLAAEKIFEIYGLPITNSYINSTIAVVLFGVFAFLINRAVKKYYKSNFSPTILSSDASRHPSSTSRGEQAPKGILNFFESILDFLLKNIDAVTKDRKRTLKFLPIVGSFFVFILISNWMGLLPGTGSIGIYQMHNGTVELIPLLRPSNTDLNMTVALAIFAVAGAHIIGVATIGFFKYANKFIKIGDIFYAIKSLSPMKIMVAIIEFFVGLLELVSEVAKMLSLSLRLFGNIFAGEVLLTVMAGLLLSIIPISTPGIGGIGMLLALPFLALEILVAVIQAVVFSMLALVYLTMATEKPHTVHNEDSHNEDKKVALSVS